jgi:polyhydroxyalkanoate synthesis regulator phasin
MKKKKITIIEDLAVLVQNEFLAVNKKIDELKNEVLEIKADLENIKLRMGEMVFRFEIQDIEKRLRKLEEKVGLK